VAGVVLVTIVLVVGLHLLFVQRVNECRDHALSFFEAEGIETVLHTPPDVGFLQLTGSTVMAFDIPLPPADAQTTVARIEAAAMRQAVVSGDFSDVRGMPTGRYTISAPETGGSTIAVVCP
jgi:hypothetical protein